MEVEIHVHRMLRRAPIAIFKSYLFLRFTAECQQTSAQRPCRVLKVPLKCIQTSTMCMNVFSLRTRPCSWTLTWTLRAPVPPRCVVSPLPRFAIQCHSFRIHPEDHTHAESVLSARQPHTSYDDKAAPECDLWRMKHLYMHSIKMPQRARAQKSYHPSGISTMDFSYARIVCSRVAAPMRPVCHRAVTATHQCALRK